MFPSWSENRICRKDWRQFHCIAKCVWLWRGARDFDAGILRRFERPQTVTPSILDQEYQCTIKKDRKNVSLLLDVVVIDLIVTCKGEFVHRYLGMVNNPVLEEGSREFKQKVLKKHENICLRHSSTLRENAQAARDILNKWTNVMHETEPTSSQMYHQELFTYLDM